MATTASLTDAGRVLLGVSVVAVTAAVVVAARPPGEARLQRWATRFGLALTRGNRPVLSAYLRRTQLLRALGAGLGWLGNPAWIAVRGHELPHGGNSVALAIGGYLLGAVVAEATLPRRRSAAGARVASLVPRTLGDYLPPVSVSALRLLPFAAVALTVLYAVLARHPRIPLDYGVAFMVVLAGALVVFAAAVEAVLRWIVTRPQPLTAPDLLAADDAVRAGSIHALAGAALAMLLSGAGWVAMEGGTIAAAGAVRGVLFCLGLALMVAAAMSGLGLARPRSWRVGRRVPLEAGR